MIFIYIDLAMGEGVYVRIEDIAAVTDETDDAYTTVFLRSGEKFAVAESAESFFERLQEVIEGE